MPIQNLKIVHLARKKKTKTKKKKKKKQTSTLPVHETSLP